MSFQLSIFSGMIALAWALSLPLDSLLSVALALLVFGSHSVPVSLLLLLMLYFIAFIQASLGGRKSGNGLTQKRYALSFFGVFTALFGASMSAYTVSYSIIFYGLLLALTSGFTLIFFGRHLERLTLKAYVQSSVIPSLVAINILLKIKTDMKAETAQLWDISLMVFGLFTFLYSSLLAVTRERLKPSLIYLSEAWIGMLIFLSVIDFENLNQVAFTSISIFCVTSVVLLSLAWQLGERYFSFAKLSFLGLPGLVGLTSLYYAVHMTIGLNIAWLLLLGLGYMLIAITLIRARPGIVQANTKIKIRFWLVTAVQMASGIAIYLMEKGGAR